MLSRDIIRALIPHQGAMCLLDAVARWSAAEILCETSSHLDPTNPLRRAGRLGAVCGIEYALQAAALHGALIDGAAQLAGYLASARDVGLAAERLDDAAIGVMRVEARLLQRDAAALSYAFRLTSAAGATLLDGRATIALPRGVA